MGKIKQVHFHNLSICGSDTGSLWREVCVMMDKASISEGFKLGRECKCFRNGRKVYINLT